MDESPLSPAPRGRPTSSWTRTSAAPSCATGCPRSLPRPWQRRPRRCRATRALSAARWATTSRPRCRWRWPASSSSPPAAATPTRARRTAPRWRAPTPSVAVRRAAAGPWTRCSPPTRSAPGSPGGRWPTPRPRPGSPRPRWPASLSWSSPTSTSCPRPASRGTPTSCPPRGPRALPRPAGPEPALRRGCRRARGQRGRADWPEPRTLTAVLLPAAQVRGVLSLLGSGRCAWGTSCPASRTARALAAAGPGHGGCDRRRCCGSWPASTRW